MASKIAGKAFKIVVVGDCVGKTSLIERYTKGTFRNDYKATIGANFAVKSLSIKGKTITLQIWDLAGQPHYKDVRQQHFYKGASGVVYVFDVTRRETFENLNRWRREVTETCGNIPSVIVGNKIDLLPREVEKKEGERYSKSLNIPYFETSAATGKNIHKVFKTIAILTAQT